MPVLKLKGTGMQYNNFTWCISAQECAAVDGATLDYDTRMLLQFCKAHMRLIDTYVAQEKFNSSPDYESCSSTDEVSTVMCLI